MSTECHTNLVRFTTTLARRLGVSRRTINRWLKHPRAPKKVSDRWNVWAWLEFLQTEGLYGTRLIDGCRVALNVAGLINERLPQRVPRTTERVLLEVIEHLLPYDRTARCEFQASAPSTGSRAVVMPKPRRIEDINPWNLSVSR